MIPDLFTVALPVLPHVLDTRGFSCLHDDNRWYPTLPGHDVRKTRGGPQKRQEHRDLLVEVYHRVWPEGGGGRPELYAPTVILKGTERRSCSSSHNNERPWFRGRGLANSQTPKNYNPLWYHQYPRGSKFKNFKCNHGQGSSLKMSRCPGGRKK